MNATCRFCGTEGPQPVLSATERMFGVGRDFRYARCLGCGTLRLLNVPSDLGQFYPQDYYAYENVEYPPMRGLALALKKLLARHYYQRFHPLAALLTLRYPKRVAWLPRGAVPFDAPVLDIGCGGGRTLALLAHEGFTNLTGLDPYLEESRINEKFRLLKQEPVEHQGSYKLIYALHVLEHVHDPYEFLGQVHRLLGENGLCVIAMPNPASLAFHFYRQFWYALDAPRHLVLYSPEAFHRIAEESGLYVYHSYSDSTTEQFLGSEQYLRGKTRAEFDDIRGSRYYLAAGLTALLNRIGYGDSRIYFLRKQP